MMSEPRLDSPPSRKQISFIGPTAVTPENQPTTDSRPEVKMRKIEKKEIQQAEFTVAIDKGKLKQIDPAKIMKDVRFGNGHDDQRQSKIQELERVKDVMLHLPEQLEFKPGITLIVGENGAGKTTLAKALHYIAQIEWEMANNPSVSGRSEAIESILHPSPNSGRIIDIKNSGLAPDIAKTMSATDYAADGGTEITTYWNFAKEAGRLAQVQDEQGFDAMIGQHGEESIGLNRESNRQSVDKIMVDQIRRLVDWAKGPQINFFDEPEVGMSPMRHMQLLKELQSYSSKDSIAIVPTNSPVLFANPDLPRIDLRYPERGIFKPKDYPNNEISASS